MKIVFFDKDVKCAAKAALLLRRTLSNVEVGYCNQIDDPELYSGDMVIADPAPAPSSVWLAEFRKGGSSGGSTPLLLLSTNTDLISGTANDPCYALLKPYDPRDLVGIVASVSEGRVPVAMWESSRRRPS